MGKEIKIVRGNNSENDVMIYRSNVPQVDDIIVICGDVEPSFSEGTAKWLRAIPVLVNGIARAMSISAFGAMACEGVNCYPQNAHNATKLVNSCGCWSELKQLSGATMKVTKHYPITCYAPKKKSTYKWTALGVDFVETTDHEFTKEEIEALKAVIAADQERA